MFLVRFENRTSGTRSRNGNGAGIGVTRHKGTILNEMLPRLISYKYVLVDRSSLGTFWYTLVQSCCVYRGSTDPSAVSCRRLTYVTYRPILTDYQHGACPCTSGLRNFEVVSRGFFFGNVLWTPRIYDKMKLCFDSSVHVYDYRLKMACREPKHVALTPVW
jgi:hypothetical protein